MAAESQRMPGAAYTDTARFAGGCFSESLLTVCSELSSSPSSSPFTVNGV